MNSKQNNNSEIVHTISRINNREFLLVDEIVTLFFSLLNFIFPKYGAKVYAVVVMSNHIHLMHHIPTKNPETKLGKRLEKRNLLITLGDMKRHFLSQFALKANSILKVTKKGKVVLNWQAFKGELRQRFGCLVENRSKSIPVQNPNHGLANLIYMFLNPVRAGIVSHPKDYRHSNFEMYATGIKQDGFEFHPDYLALGESLGSCAKIFLELIEEQLQIILKNLKSLAKNALNSRESYFINIGPVIKFISNFFHLRI